MSSQAFVDESIRNGYLMSAVVIATGDLAAARKKLRGFFNRVSDSCT